VNPPSFPKLALFNGFQKKRDDKGGERGEGGREANGTQRSLDFTHLRSPNGIVSAPKEKGGGGGKSHVLYLHYSGAENERGNFEKGGKEGEDPVTGEICFSQNVVIFWGLAGIDRNGGRG